MRKQLEQKLLHFTRNRSTISIDELEHLLPRFDTYEEFATIVVRLEDDGILHMVKSHGRNNHIPSVAYRYRIRRNKLNRTYHQELQSYRLNFHPSVNLDAYFNLDYETWSKDLPYIKKINTYIEESGFPTEKVPAPERSFELVGDEKWIEQGGSDVLQRIKLLDKMNIFPVSDPLMFAVNPGHMNSSIHFHLIVENKTTYQALLPVLTETAFSTLIYGSGNKIPGTIENFHDQFPVEGEHIFFYFGDIDHSGMTIWHSLYKRQYAIPAIPFYEACLTKTKAYGKTNQRPNEGALKEFTAYFDQEKSDQIDALLHKGAYFPQEVLQTKELQNIWLAADWQQIALLKERITSDGTHK